MPLLPEMSRHTQPIEALLPTQVPTFTLPFLIVVVIVICVVDCLFCCCCCFCCFFLFQNGRLCKWRRRLAGSFLFIFFCISVNFFKFVFIFSGCRIACVAVSLRCAPFSRRQKKEVYYSVFLGRLLSFHFYFVHFFFTFHTTFFSSITRTPLSFFFFGVLG